jgi:hypothetical protein
MFISVLPYIGGTLGRPVVDNPSLPTGTPFSTYQERPHALKIMFPGHTRHSTSGLLPSVVILVRIRAAERGGGSQTSFAAAACNIPDAMGDHFKRVERSRMPAPASHYSPPLGAPT